jgi:ATP-dependent Lhr-like helicase
MCCAARARSCGAGCVRSGRRDGYVALYLAEDAPLLAPPATPADGALVRKVRELLRARGASFFADVHAVEWRRRSDEVFEALWDLVWAGEVSNDTLTCLRSRLVGVARRGAAGGAVGHQ